MGCVQILYTVVPEIVWLLTQGVTETCLESDLRPTITTTNHESLINNGSHRLRPNITLRADEWVTL